MGDDRTTYEKLLMLAAPSHGWFLSAAAYEQGISPSALSRLRSRGAVRSPRRNVNHLVAFPASWESSAMEQLLVAGPGAALGRWSALRIHEQRTTAPQIDVIRPRTAQRPLLGPLHRTHVRFEPDDAVVLAHFSVTTPAFTVCDLAAVTRVTVLTDVAERFIADGRLTVDELAATVARFRAVKGVERLRQMLETLDPGVEGTRSDRERVALRLVRTLDIEAPVANHQVLDAFGRTRFLDLAWPHLRLAIEIDVHSSHGTTIGRRSDGLRQNALVLDGWTILRFDLEDLEKNPADFLATVLRAYELATSG